MISRSYDYFLTNRIKLGKAQIIPAIAMMLSQMTDGIQTIMVSLITPIIKNEWQLSGKDVSLITSLFYVGIIIGSLIGGKLSDLKGRKNILAIGSAIQILSSLLTVFSSSLLTFSICRVFYGCGFGFTIVISASLLCEILPLQYRGRGLLVLNFTAALGKLIGVILAFAFIPDKKSGNWRLMLSISSIPSLIVLILVLLKVNESVRILLSQKKNNQAFQIINQMIHQNQNQSQQLTLRQKSQLIEWSQYSLKRNVQTTGFSSLLTKKYFKITILISICWFMVNFNFFGQLFILPFIMKEDNSLLSYAITVLGEIPSVLVTSYLIQNPRFGRKGSLILFGLSAALISSLVSFYRFSIFLSLSRFFYKCTIQMLYPFTTQLYQTTNRSIGFGVSSGFGRIGAVVMPYILYPIFQKKQWLVFSIFCLFSLIGVLSAYLIKTDTINLQLDQKTRNIQNSYELQHQQL